jgi:hypothetical protein
MPSASRQDRIRGTLTRLEWEQRQDDVISERPRPWWFAGSDSGKAPDEDDLPDAEGQEDAVDALRRREGSKTRRWGDMTGDRPLETLVGPVEVEEPVEPELPPRRRLVRVGNRPRSAWDESPDRGRGGC